MQHIQRLVLTLAVVHCLLIFVYFSIPHWFTLVYTIYEASPKAFYFLFIGFACLFWMLRAAWWHTMRISGVGDAVDRAARTSGRR